MAICVHVFYVCVTLLVSIMLANELVVHHNRSLMSTQLLISILCYFLIVLHGDPACQQEHLDMVGQ